VLSNNAVFLAVFLGAFPVETTVIFLMVIFFLALAREVDSAVTVLVAVGAFFVLLPEETSLTDAWRSEVFAFGFEATVTEAFEPDSTFRTEDAFPVIALFAMEFTLFRI